MAPLPSLPFFFQTDLSSLLLSSRSPLHFAPCASEAVGSGRRVSGVEGGMRAPELAERQAAVELAMGGRNCVRRESVRLELTREEQPTPTRLSGTGSQSPRLGSIRIAGSSSPPSTTLDPSSISGRRRRYWRDADDGGIERRSRPGRSTSAEEDRGDKDELAARFPLLHLHATTASCNSTTPLLLTSSSPLPLGEAE